MNIVGKIIRELKRPFTGSRELRRSVEMLRSDIAALRAAYAPAGSDPADLREMVERDRARIEALEIALRFQANVHAGVIAVASDVIEPIKDMLSLLEPHDVVGFDKIRVGGDHDGGYVMLNDFAGISAALSLGVGGDMRWDLSMAERGIDVLQFDDAADAPPIHHERCKFWPRKIVAKPSSSHIEATIESILLDANLADGRDLLLKMDIEGGEWEILASLDEDVTRRFRQIICEFHDFNQIGQSAWRLRANRALERLTRTHSVIHVHGNNSRNLLRVGNIPFPEVLEVTFARQDYELQDSRVVFPTALDRPNDARVPDIFLGTFKFR